MTVVLKCACGARERILASKIIAAGWVDIAYTCGDCLASEPYEAPLDPELVALQRQAAGDELAAAFS